MGQQQNRQGVTVTTTEQSGCYRDNHRTARVLS